MVFSLCLLAVVLTFTWVVAPTAPRWATPVAVAAVVGLSVVRAARTGEWGVKGSAFVPALAWSAALTAAAALGIYAAGLRLGTWHTRDDLWMNFAVLVPWALGQQFALHTVFLREAQATVSRPGRSSYGRETTSTSAFSGARSPAVAAVSASSTRWLRGM